jgi:hypothetical protein
MVRRPSLEQCDRIHYLYHYGGDWHFYAILKSVLDDESGDTEPDAVNRKGEPIDRHNPSRETFLSESCSASRSGTNS